MVPEVLFRPSDIGLQQAGLAETLVEAVSHTHPALHPLLYTNVLLTGKRAARAFAFKINRPIARVSISYRWGSRLPRILASLQS